LVCCADEEEVISAEERFAPEEPSALESATVSSLLDVTVVLSGSEAA
jgi:hypothetical protein